MKDQNSNHPTLNTRFAHAPKDYLCPICLGVKGVVSDKTLLLPQDVVYKDSYVTGFINSFWIKGNEGHVIVVPNKHYENLYDLPEDLGTHIFSVSKKIALAMKKSYNCDGITALQNNEPAGGQHALHYHLHIFPRYEGDSLHANMSDKLLADPTARKEYAGKLSKQL